MQWMQHHTKVHMQTCEVGGIPERLKFQQPCKSFHESVPSNYDQLIHDPHVWTWRTAPKRQTTGVQWPCERRHVMMHDGCIWDLKPSLKCINVRRMGPAQSKKRIKPDGTRLTMTDALFNVPNNLIVAPNRVLVVSHTNAIGRKDLLISHSFTQSMIRNYWRDQCSKLLARQVTAMPTASMGYVRLETFENGHLKATSDSHVQVLQV